MVLTWLEQIGVVYRVEVVCYEWQRSCWWNIGKPSYQAPPIMR